MYNVCLYNDYKWYPIVTPIIQNAPLLPLSRSLIVFLSLFFSSTFFYSACTLFDRVFFNKPNYHSKHSVFVQTMVSKALMGVWVALDILLLAACVLTLALSVVWRAPNTLINMVLSSAALNGTILFLGPTSES